MNPARLAELFRRHAQLHGEIAKVETEIAEELHPPAAPAPPPRPSKPAFKVPDDVSPLDRHRARRALERRGFTVRDRDRKAP